MTDPTTKGSTPVPPRPGKKGRPANRPAGRGNGVSARTTNGRAANGRQPSGRQARQATQRRNRMMAVGAVAAVVAIVVVLVVVKVAGGSSNGALRHPATAATVTKLTNVDTSILTSAANAVNTDNLYPAVPATGAQTGSGGVMNTGGKPELLYIGAEFCPICATERWAMVIALSKFGTWSNLQQTHSAITDGNIPTLSFYGAKYTSQYLDFKSYEVEDNTRKTLENPPANVQTMWNAYFNGQPAFPYINLGGQLILASSQFPYTILEGKSFDDILSSVGSNNNTVGADIDASAAVLTKYICQMTNDQPASVCSAVSNVKAPVNSNPSGGQSSPASGS